MHQIFREKVTGAHSDRRELLKMLKHLAPGDVVIVTRIDRLARSTFDLFAIVKQIVDAKAQFRSLAEPWADTATSTGRLMIAVLGGLADVERDLIRTRTAEGRSRAQKRGQHMGRPPKLTAEQQAEASKRRAQAQSSPNWRAATALGKVRFRDYQRDGFSLSAGCVIIYKSVTGNFPMTKLLDQAVEAARNLPPDAQDDIAHVVLRLAGADDEPPVPLTPDEQAAITTSKAAAARGEFATDEEVRAVWAKHGL